MLGWDAERRTLYTFLSLLYPYYNVCIFWQPMLSSTISHYSIFIMDNIQYVLNIAKHYITHERRRSKLNVHHHFSSQLLASNLTLIYLYSAIY